MHLTLERQITLGFALALMMLGTLDFVAWRSSRQSVAGAVSVREAQATLTQLATLWVTMSEAEASQRGFTITGDAAFLEPYRRAAEQTQVQLEALRRRLTDPAQRERLESIAPLLTERLAFAGRVIRLGQSEGFAAAQQLTKTGQGKALQDQVRTRLEAMQAAERSILDRREAETRATARLTFWVAGVGGVGAIALLGVAWGVIQRGVADRRQAQRRLQASEAETRRHNEELAAAKQRAEAADRLKSVFLATMSHELRTPLNSIIGFTGILRQELPGPLNDEQRKQLGMVRSSARHLLALINDVLDLSKIEAGELKVDRAAFDLRAVIRQAVATVQPQADQRGLALRVEVAPSVGDAVSDARRVEQILLNLLTNAVKFTPHGEVVLRAEVVDGIGRMEVADTGLGIRPEDLGTLFQPFRQLDDGMTREHEGTGLGLTICRRLARLLGGEVTVTSVRGQGSTFTLTLPLETPAP